MSKKGFAPLVTIIIAFVIGTGIIVYQFSKTRNETITALTPATSTKLQVNQPPAFVENIDSQIKKETNASTSQPTNNQTVCDYSEYQKTISEKDKYIEQLEQKTAEFQEINKQWVSAENQWKTEKSQLEQQILTWQKGSTNFIKLIQQNTLDMIAKALIDSTYDNSSYNILLKIAQTPIEQELLLKTLTANARYACQSLNSYVQTGMITTAPQYGEQCQRVENLFNALSN